MGASVTIRPTPYDAVGDAIVGHNLGQYYNRPLFINNTDAFLQAGDRPMVRFGQGQRVYGALMIALVRGTEGKWLHQCGDILAAYRAGRMTWTIRDAHFDGVRLTLDAVPMAGAIGFALRLAAEGTRPGDRLVWAYGGTLQKAFIQGEGPSDISRKPRGTGEFEPEECRNTVVGIGENGLFTLALPSEKGPGTEGCGPMLIAGRCSAASELAVADAAVWKDPVVFSTSELAGLPLLRGSTALGVNGEVIWVCEAFDGDKPGNLARLLDPAETFAEGVRRTEGMAARVTASTPEPRLDALLSCAAAEVDGIWYPPVFVHATTPPWNMPYVGWYTIYGNTICGWHERVKEAAAFYIGSQVRQSPNVRAKPDPARRHCIEHPDSRFYGVGRILTHQYRYDMQSQFFDQLINEWRWTGDPELERLLRPALELHLQWARECFDPDGDGLYESYINTMPTDSVWYNGGGSAEETAFVYRAHKAALDMARRANDAKAVEAHQATLAQIKAAFFERLWIPGKGHPGKYREQGGHQRLHEDPWLYSICLPIEAGLLTPEQAAEALDYTERALENVRTPFGGRYVWASNWVPAVRSVRWRDSEFLPLSYFQCGLAEDGWDCLKGQMLDSFADLPAHLSQGANTLYRQVVEGLFGCAPDYPNGVVRIAPQFPADWDHASIRTPDLAVRFTRQGDDETLAVEIGRPAALDLCVPVRARRVAAVTVDGKPVPWEVLPAFGKSVVRIRLPECKSAAVTVSVRDRLPQFAPVAVQGEAGQEARLAVEGDGLRLLEYADPQGVLEQAALQGNAVVGRLGTNAGHHTVHALVQAGELPQRRLFRLTVADPAAQAARDATCVRQIPPAVTWETIDLREVLNADIRTIYQQQYLSPRPETCSVRIGSDGYSPWTFSFWGINAPDIRLDGIPKLLDASHQLQTPQGVPFSWPGETRNVAFTSLWDNWPRRVTAPVGKKAAALWMLICGSTNPMQCQIANAVIRLRYADGQEDSMELVPPLNYWNLCPIGAGPSKESIMDRTDYDYRTDAFCLPKIPPPTVQLGENCRAMVLHRRLRPDATLDTVTLETLSQEVVVGLMGLTLMRERT
jgi:hypothetical protein